MAASECARRRRPLRLLLALCVASAALALAAAARDYYEVLGVARDASQAEIKRAFRQLSLKVPSLPAVHSLWQGDCMAHCSLDNGSTTPTRTLVMRRPRRSSPRSPAVRHRPQYVQCLPVHSTDVALYPCI